MDALKLDSTRINSPVGIIEITGSAEGVRSVIFQDGECDPANIPECLVECVNQLNEYFDGKRKTFNLKLDPQGTEFQLKVWEKLQTIPFGKTIQLPRTGPHDRQRNQHPRRWKCQWKKPDQYHSTLPQGNWQQR